MILKLSWSVGVLLALALAVGGCTPSPKEAAAGRAFLASAQKRLANIENAERVFHQRDFHCGDQPKSKVDEKIGDLVEARVLAKLELSRLQQEGSRSVEHLKAALEPTLRKAEKRFSDLKQLCPTT